MCECVRVLVLLSLWVCVCLLARERDKYGFLETGCGNISVLCSSFLRKHTHTEDPGGCEIRFFNFLVWKQVSDQNVSKPCFCEQQKAKGSKQVTTLPSAY